MSALDPLIAELERHVDEPFNPDISLVIDYVVVRLDDLRAIEDVIKRLDQQCTTAHTKH